MTFVKDHFEGLLDLEVETFLKYTLSKGFIITLVGGGVRDYFLNNSLTKDLDFEIKIDRNLDEQSWINFLKEFFINVQEDFPHYKIRELKYCIYRIEIGEYELEFSSPRIETMTSSLTHDYFSAKYVSNLSYSEAFKRRDLTINAIGIRFSLLDDGLHFDIIDPFNGLDDLTNKIISHIDESFFRDYVRFLRMIRFECLLDFKVSEETKLLLSKFNLSHLSHYYFFYEFKKCFSLNDPLIFVRKLYEYISLAKIEMNETLITFKPLECVNVNNSHYAIKDDFLRWLSLHTQIEEDQKLLIISLMNLSLKKYKRYKRSKTL